jgi:pimeloyl-ACP methyl ester carboxylesterase
MKPDFLHIDEVRLEYRRVGAPPATAPTLVFLHEGLGCVSLWKDFPDRAAAATGWGALGYSRAGYGASDPVALPRPLTYLHHEGVEVLPRVLDAAGIRRAVLVGHSDGASIALIHAGAVRDPRIAGAVLMAPHVFNEPSCISGVLKAREAYEQGRLREQLARHHGTNTECAFRGWNDTWLDPGFCRWNIEEILPAITTPLLVIQGREDGYGTAAQIEAIARQVSGPVRTLWLENCGHSPYRDRPEETLMALTEFVRGLDAVTRDEEIQST